MVVNDPTPILPATWQNLAANSLYTSTTSTSTANPDISRVIEHFEEVLKILEKLDSQLTEKYQDAKGFYEDDGEEQSLGEMVAYEQAKLIVSSMHHTVYKDLQSRKSVLNANTPQFTYQPFGHLGI